MVFPKVQVLLHVPPTAGGLVTDGQYKCTGRLCELHKTESELSIKKLNSVPNLKSSKVTVAVYKMCPEDKWNLND